MEYRNELKFQLTYLEMQKIRYRLENMMAYDQNQDGDFYTVQSLYFDDIYDSCFYESRSGVDNRKKYRIRIYNGDPGRIHLEKKCKVRDLTKKVTEEISLERCRKLVSGNQTEGGGDLEKELDYMIQSKKMMPKCIVEYDRCAMVEQVGNVRITFDMKVRGSIRIGSFPDGKPEGFETVMLQGMHILEVKYDELLPEYIRRTVNLETLQRQSVSKYVLVRQKFNGQRSMVI